MAEIDNNPDNDSRRNWYRIYDVKTGKVAMIGIAGIILLVIAMYLTNQYFLATTHKQIADVLLTPPSASLEALHAHEDSVLTSYGVSDSTNKTYRIPISEAMKILADSAKSTRIKMGREP